MWGLLFPTQKSYRVYTSLKYPGPLTIHKHDITNMALILHGKPTVGFILAPTLYLLPHIHRSLLYAHDI